jgi:hypothetical protein
MDGVVQQFTTKSDKDVLNVFYTTPNEKMHGRGFSATVSAGDTKQ